VRISVRRMSRFVLLSFISFTVVCEGSGAKRYKDLPELSPLGNAARHQDLPRVKALIQAGADVNAAEKNGETPLYDALECEMKCDNLPVVEFLLDHGAELNGARVGWGTPLTFSLTRQYGNAAATITLIRRGSIVSKSCNGEDTDLSLATQDSSLEVMEALLNKGADPNCRDSHGIVALYWAVINGQADRAELLLRHGADPNVKQPPIGDSSKLVTLLDCAKGTNPERRVQQNFEQTRAVLRRYGAMGSEATR
jgi:ankyrin repeat protein